MENGEAHCILMDPGQIIGVKDLNSFVEQCTLVDCRGGMKATPKDSLRFWVSNIEGFARIQGIEESINTHP